MLLWCLPALLLAIVLRVWLAIDLPYAYYHDDAPDFLTTPDRLFHEGKWELHEKKTFLVPALFTAPFLLPFPVMKTIPLGQHLLGLGLIVVLGALCRLWFQQWRWWIVPLTALAAINPFYLWYERTLMAETTFLFCTLLVVFAGTLYARHRTLARFVFLCVVLVLEAGGRPEGKLLFGFGLFLLFLVHWREWWSYRVRIGAMVLVAIATHLCTKTSQAGLLLYTSVARLTPTELKCAPGFDPYIEPIRADLQARWAERPQFPRVRDRRAIAGAVDKYLKEHASAAGKHAEVNAFCLKLAKETCIRSLGKLPGLALAKFRAVANESPGGLFDQSILFGKQREAVVDSLARFSRLSHGLTGKTIATQDEADAWLNENYHEIGWFNQLDRGWLATVNAWRLKDAVYPNPAIPGGVIVLPGIPLYFIAALAGVLLAMCLRGENQLLHVAWSLTLLAFFFTIMLTANVRPRFRFVFEPYWFLYVAMIMDAVVSGVRAALTRK